MLLLCFNLRKKSVDIMLLCRRKIMTKRKKEIMTCRSLKIACKEAIKNEKKVLSNTKCVC